MIIIIDNILLIIGLILMDFYLVIMQAKLLVENIESMRTHRQRELWKLAYKLSLITLHNPPASIDIANNIVAYYPSLTEIFHILKDDFYLSGIAMSYLMDRFKNAYINMLKINIDKLEDFFSLYLFLVIIIPFSFSIIFLILASCITFPIFPTIFYTLHFIIYRLIRYYIRKFYKVD